MSGIFCSLCSNKISASTNNSLLNFKASLSCLIVIAHSEELGSFIRNNYADLKSGKEVSGSFRFNGFTNLHNAFGSVDVLSAKVRGNYVDVTLLDTYDFNKNDKNLFVKMGRRAQETGKLNPYFTIVKCRYKLK